MRRLVALALLGLGSTLLPLHLEGQTPTPDADGYSAGQTVGGTKSVAKAHLLAGTTSLMLPGAGLIYLAFLNTGEVEPNFAEQATLQGKSPAFIQSWTQGYDDALTRRQKKAILVSTAVGSAIAFLVIYRPLFGSSY